MSKAILSIAAVTLLAMIALLSACGSTGPGSLVTEEKEFTGFTQVDVQGTFNVEITQSESFSITISADRDFFDYVAVVKEGQTLKIYLNPHHAFTDFTQQARTLKAKIAMPTLSGLQISGASKASISGFRSAADFSLDVSGASSVDIKDVKLGNTELIISGASKVSGSLEATQTEVDISGASSIKLSGSATGIMLTASGASKIDLDEFPLDNANVKLSGASEASLHVKGRLDCILVSASRLYFQGNPTMGNTSVTGASTIKHK